MTTQAKQARADHPIHPLIAKRWSPYGFSDKPVPLHDLRSLFEAARWAPSSYNEQPWSYILATKDNEKEFERLLACLTDANQKWARRAPLLALGVVQKQHEKNDKTNPVASHDLGLAAAHLTFEATARGLMVHQMAGIHPDKAREVYNIPEGYEALTAIAVGYLADDEETPDKLQERDESPRRRDALGEFVFEGEWGAPSTLMDTGAEAAPAAGKESE